MNTTENKAKFFAQYWGQRVLIRNYRHMEYDDVISVYHYNWGGWESVACLELTQLSQISDDDVIKVHSITFPRGYKSDFLTVKGRLKSIESIEVEKFDYFPISAWDYLRSRGYALPWLGISVEQQVEWGWVKLKEREQS